MDERRDTIRQRRALRPSQLRLGKEDDIGLPARLSHIQNYLGLVVIKAN